jgi:trimeric autotransporter adhesin
MVTVSSVNGCSATDLVTVNIIPLPIANAGPDQTFCAGPSTTLTASGGTYYQWSTGDNTSVITITPWTTTTYFVTVVNLQGCSASDEVTVNVNPLPIADAGPNQTICAGSAATFVATGGSSYLWSTGIASSTLVVAPTSHSTYTVTVTNNSGCSAVDSVSVSITASPNMGVVPNAPMICQGGSVQLTASGAFTYAWSPPMGLSATTGATVTASPTSTTAYTVTGTDIAGCSATASITVTIGSGLLVYVTPSSPSICPGSSVQLTASGALNYTWLPGSGLSDSTGAIVIASPATTATYTVVGTDAVGCSGSTTVVVDVNIINAATATTDENCSLANGTLTVSPVGACSQGFTYIWNTVPPQNTQTVTNVPAGIYTVSVYCGACYTTVTDTILNVAGPALTISNVVNTTCGLSNGSATVNVSGGVVPYNYTWSDGQITPVLSNVPAGTYSVSVQDAVGCITAATVVIAPSLNLVTTAYSINADCNVSNGSATVVVVQGSGNYSYFWSTVPVQTTASITGIPAGTYVVTVSDSMCVVTDTVDVYSNAGPTADFSAYPTVVSIENALVYFTDQSSSNTVSWLWEFGDGSPTSINQSPTHIFGDTGTFVVTLVVTDVNGCTDIVTDTIEVQGIFAYYIPNTFTPNDDGKNDIWLPKGLGVDPNHFHMDIFDRWGNLTFETNDPNEGWNGTKMNRLDGTKAIMDVYVYKIKLRDMQGNIYNYFGHINLIP